MKQSYFLLLTLALFTISHEIYSQTQGKRGSVSDVQFITGSWKAQAGERSIDAAWSAPDGESMVGYVRVQKEAKVALYELFAFEQSEQGLVVFVRHFNPGLIPWEEKDKPDHYVFMEAGKGWAMFQKQGADVRVRYEKRSEDDFAIVLGKPKDGVWQFQDFWQFKRVK